MKRLIIWLVSLAVLGFLPDVIADGQKKDIHYVKLPNDKLLMPLSEFELHIVDKQMGEMYFAIVKPPAFAPDINYKSTINKVSGSPNYTQITIGETPVVNSQCASGNTPLSPVGRDRALFYRGNNVRSVQAMWSSNPSRYIWSMRCENYFPGKRLCLLSESNFGVYVHGGLDDIPLSLHEDLCKATGLSFGDEKFKWFFSYGENTLC